jgi:uncharacterized protein with PQ loop repeat
VWLSVLGWTGSLMAGARALPQLAKLWRSREPSGVSSVAIMAFGATEIAWLIYSVQIADKPAAVASALPLPSCLATCWLLWRAGAMGRREQMSGLLFTVGLLVCTSLGPAAVGTVAAVGSAIWSAPQVLRLIRARGAFDGISRSMWAVVAANAVLWLVYAVGTGHALLGLPSLPTLPAALYILVKTRATSNDARTSGAQRVTSSAPMTYARQA